VNDTVVYTAITGSYNELKPHPDVSDVDWIAFLDEPQEPENWTIRKINAPHWLGRAASPREVAKAYKLFPHECLSRYPRSVWIDGTVTVTDPRFPAEALRIAERTGIGLWRHPERDCIYAEAEVSLRFPKYREEPIEDQVAYYHDQLYPEHGGLWAGGIIARYHDRFRIEGLMSCWWAEINRWSIQDQLSLAYCLRQLRISPGEFPASLYANPWLTVTGHDPSR
jgi:Protein of unknown function (DUF616)